MNWTFFDYVTMFFSSFMLVFLLGFQSKNVQNSRYFLAVLTSFGISLANFLFVKFAADGQLVPFIICATGGCIGIACSIWVGDRFHRARQTPAIAPESICKREGRCRAKEGAETAAEADRFFRAPF